jgi:anhydro-N-acetylmuramic acid kinase
MSGSSLDGLDIAFVHFEETAGKWQFEIQESACIPYPAEWKQKLSTVSSAFAKEYFLLHTAYGHWLGSRVNDFLEEKNLSYRVQLIASHGHTIFHLPNQRTTVQLGDGASIAAVTGIRTITDLRSVDVALGPRSAVVPIGENCCFRNMIFPEYRWDRHFPVNGENFIGFDVCPLTVS